MKTFTELVSELCPNGVQYKSFFDVVVRIREKAKEQSKTIPVFVISSKMGLIPIEDYWGIDSSAKPSEDTSNYTIVRRGEFAYNPARLNIGSLALMESDQCLISPMYVAFRLKDDCLLDERYVLYFLKSSYVSRMIDSYKETGARFRFDFSNWEKIKIPIPPFEIQKKIVQILDTFLELSTQLNHELSVRKKQFEYYRNIVFDGLKAEPFLSVSEVAIDKFWLMPATPQYIDSGIPYITSKNVKNGLIDFSDVKYISDSDFDIISKNRTILKNDFLITMIGTIGECAIVTDFTKFYGQNIYLVRLDVNKCLPKYFYHFISQEKIKNSLAAGKNASSQGYIKAGSIDNLKIPIPTIDRQKEIIESLDIFDAYCNNLSYGLPAEINARQKQYEYYRDKLLTFKELKA